MKYFFLPLLFSFVFFACQKKKETPSVIVYATPTGSIAGKVKLADQNGATQTLAPTGATVSIVGRPYSTQVTEKGTYTLNNVPAGVYDLDVTLPDGAGIRTQQVSFVGNGLLLLDITTSNKSKDTIQFSAKDTSFTFVRGFKVRATGGIRTFSTRLIVIFSTQENIDPADPETFVYSETGFLSAFSFPQVSVYENFFELENFKQITNLPSGVKVFVHIFPVAFYNTFYDYYSGKMLAKGVGKVSNPPVEIIVP